MPTQTFAQVLVRAGLLIALSAWAHLGFAQTTRQFTWADSVLERLAGHKQDDARRAAELARKASNVLEQGSDPCKALHIRSLLANYLDRIGAVDSAAALFLDDRFTRIGSCPPHVQKDYYRFLTNVQISLGEFVRVDSICRMAYELGRTGPLKGVDLSELRCNHGVAVASMGRLDEAMSIFKGAYDEARGQGSRENMINSLHNIATINAMMRDLVSARRNYEEVRDLLRVGGFSDRLVRCYQNLGSVHRDLGNLKTAIAYQDSAIALARSSGFLEGEAAVYTRPRPDPARPHPEERGVRPARPLPAAARQHPRQRPNQGRGRHAREVRDGEESCRIVSMPSHPGGIHISTTAA